MLDKTASFRMDAAERALLARDGYVVRRGVFDEGECASIARDCEALVERLECGGRHEKHVVGSYMFEIEREAGAVVKWEPGAPEVVQGVEPFAHISKPLEDWGLDARLTDPCKDIVGEDEVVLFTEKLNVKRARHGGPIVLHQDYPYWEKMTPISHRIATAMVFLDETTIENGCLEVAPGTHTVGKWPHRADADGFGSLETRGPSNSAALSPWKSRPGRWPSSALSWCTGRCPTIPVGTAELCSIPTSRRAIRTAARSTGCSSQRNRAAVLSR